MTLSEFGLAQEEIRAKIAAQRESGESGTTLEVARDAQVDLDLKQWQKTVATERFVNDLCDKIEQLDQQARNLAMLDTDCALAIRALLIESATLRKAISYARRTDYTSNY